MNHTAARGEPRAHVARSTAGGNAHPRALPPTAAPPPKGSRRPDSFESAAGTPITGLISPSALSSKVSFGTTRNEQTAPPLPCSGSARPRRLLLRPLSHPTAFEPPARHARAPGRDPGGDRASQVRCDLRPTRHVGSGLPHGQVTARPPLPGRRSFRRAWRDDFWGANTEASPYPSVTGLFPVRHRPGSDSLATAFAALVVELFAAGVLSPGRRLRYQPVPRVATPGTPHASAVVRA